MSWLPTSQGAARPSDVFAIASYNVLADAYLTADRYPRTPPALLAPGARTPALADTIALLDADVVCLQEVERETFERLTDQLGVIGYTGSLMMKTGRRPDGCATFSRTPASLVGVHEHAYRDGRGGARDSAHVALIAVVEVGGRRVAVANTHLKWSAPATAIADQWAHRQLSELVALLDTMAGSCDARVVCGDFNVEPDSPAVAVIEAAGYTAALGSLTGANTCNTHGVAKKIDFIFHTDALVAAPRTPPPIGADTVLPSERHASDHLAICAGFTWRPEHQR